jgi:hypothetical protein
MNIIVSARIIWFTQLANSSLELKCHFRKGRGRRERQDFESAVAGCARSNTTVGVTGINEIYSTCLSLPLDALKARQRRFVALLLLLLRLAVGRGGCGAPIPVARRPDAKPAAYTAAIPVALRSVVTLAPGRGLDAVGAVQRLVVVVGGGGVPCGAPESLSAVPGDYTRIREVIMMRMERRGRRCEDGRRAGRIRCAAPRTLHLDAIHLGSMREYGQLILLAAAAPGNKPAQVIIIA